MRTVTVSFNEIIIIYGTLEIDIVSLFVSFYLWRTDRMTQSSFTGHMFLQNKVDDCVDVGKLYIY